MYILWIHLFEKHFKIMFEIKFENMSAYFEKKIKVRNECLFFFLQWNRALWKIYIDHNFRTNILLQSADIMTICEHQWIWYIVIGNKKRIIRYRIITISSCKLIAGKRFLFFFFFSTISYSAIWEEIVHSLKGISLDWHSKLSYCIWYTLSSVIISYVSKSVHKFMKLKKLKL